MSVSRPTRLGDRLRRGGRLELTPEQTEIRSPALNDLVVITGYSGAGKSTAMAAFEDEGYFCVDNLPPEMIRSLAELFMHPGSKVERAAVVSDARGGSYFDGLVVVLGELERAGVSYRVLFLEADEQTLLTRYQETRRRHPLSPAGSVTDGIATRAHAACAGARARRPRDRHDRADERDAATQARRRAAADAHARPPRRDDPELRLQARAGARRRPAVRRALPAESPLRGPAAPADGPRPGGRGLREPRRSARRLLRALDPDARLPAAAVHRGGQGTPRRSRSAAPAGATARSRSRSTSPRATASAATASSK